jgi:hypothetical protein
VGCAVLDVKTESCCSPSAFTPARLVFSFYHAKGETSSIERRTFLPVSGHDGAFIYGRRARDFSRTSAFRLAGACARLSQLCKYWNIYWVLMASASIGSMYYLVFNTL